jgi:hypothetical protein
LSSEKSNFYEPEYKLVRIHTIGNGSSVNCLGQEGEASNYFAVAQGDLDRPPSDWHAPDSKMLYYPADCVWAIYRSSTQTIWNHINFTFQAQQLQTDPVYSEAFGGPVALRRMYRDNQYMNLDTTNEFMQNMTRSMTAVIRTNGAQNFIHPAEGTMWYTTTCIRVRWK